MDLEPDSFTNRDLNWVLYPKLFMNRHLKYVSDQFFMGWSFLEMGETDTRFLTLNGHLLRACVW